ncbi:MAG: hypothetical protein JSU00_20320 [Acidobacteria bacterium]|nr:hypothetical protein [Acidobacteriota bacterium]
MASALAAAVSAALFWFGTGLHPVWFTLWLAPLPVLLAAARTRGWIAFATAALGWAAGAMNMWAYWAKVGVPVPVRILATLGPALIFGAGVALWRRFQTSGRYWLAAAALPTLDTAFEFVQAVTSVHGTFGSLAYSQADALPVIQLASVTGIAGVTFLALLGASAVATLRRGPMLAAFAVILAATGGGWLRLRQDDRAPRVTVGLAACDRQEYLFPSQPAAARALAQRYAAAARELAQRGAALVILPEKIARLTDDQMDAFDEPMAGAGVEVAAGVERWTPAAKRNEIRLYSKNGRVEALYEKHHMLPAFESHLLVGTERVLLMRPSGEWGMTICKDMDFPALSREYGRDGAGLLIVPAWDFVDDGWLHSRMAILRGVESGFTVARAAKQGRLTVSDNRGRVLGEQITGDFATLLAAAPVAYTRTLYASYGDWFGWLTVISLAGLGLMIRRR